MSGPAADLARRALAEEERGDFDAAERLALAALALAPSHPDALYVRARNSLRAGDVKEGDALLERLTVAVPKLPGPWAERVTLRLRSGDGEGALILLDRARSAGARANGLERLRATALRQLARYTEAVSVLRRTLARDPEDREALEQLARALLATAQFSEAVVVQRRRHALDPQDAMAHADLARTLLWNGQVDESIACARQLIERRPDWSRSHDELANALLARGRTDAACAAWRRAVAVDPGDAVVHGNLLLGLNFSSGIDREGLAAEHARWADRHAPQRPRPRPFANGRDPERRLRIGYLSGDFRRHAVGLLFESFFTAHDPGCVECFCYSNVPQPDAVTARIQARADEWRVLRGRSLEEIVERIEADGIDILVDLGGHTGHGRLIALAFDPAPVQMSWLGYPGTTGMRQVHARFSDAVVDPPHLPRPGPERVLPITGGITAFTPHVTAEITPLPALHHRAITFGSLNRADKLNDAVVALWSDVLRACPDARLRLVHTQMRDAAAGWLRAAFAEHGVAERVDMVTPPDMERYLESYGEIDIALDPFPWNGHVTTCEALWMGVPVLARGDGRNWADRLSASVLVHAGLGEWVAKDRADYVRIAVQRAQDIAGLAALRATLRDRFAASPVMDGTRLAREIEAHYRALWREWCARGAQSMN